VCDEMRGDDNGNGVFYAGEQAEQLRAHGIAPATWVLLNLNGQLSLHERPRLVEDDVRHL
jgi:hypothetical protein